MEAEPVLVNVSQWIDENKHYFVPPICNKLMHDVQINIMFVGGPNERLDFHLEHGEELFLQLKGDMLLKVVERGRHRDVVIKEGEMFLLPGRIPHSPQRVANTVGLVIERRRAASEIDGLRFYVQDTGGKQTVTPLYEAWFHWETGKYRMPDYITEFKASEQYKTGKPIAGTIREPCPIDVDTQRELGNPFRFREWISRHRQQIDSSGKTAVFDPTKHQLQVFVYGPGENADCFEQEDTWIWQMEGESKVEIDKGKQYILNHDDSLLVPKGSRFKVSQGQGCLALVVCQIPVNGH